RPRSARAPAGLDPRRRRRTVELWSGWSSQDTEPDHEVATAIEQHLHNRRRGRVEPSGVFVQLSIDGRLSAILVGQIDQLAAHPSIGERGQESVEAQERLARERERVEVLERAE